jgi:CIC family chloride channel protein
LGSGGSGGVFAPTLFMGAAFGGALGLFFDLVFPGAIVEPMAFALVGMAALFAGSGRAPITCIVIIMEMTNDYSIILPLMIAVSASYLVASSIEAESIYTLKLARRGIRIDSGSHIGALKAIKVSDVMTKVPTVLSPMMTPEEVLEIIDNTHHTKFPVIGDDGTVQGILIAEDLFHETPPDEPQPLVRDLMNPNFLHLSPGCRMDSALHAMMKRDEGHAVIVDPLNPGVMMGYITKADVLKAYELAILKLQQQGQDVEDIEPADIIESDF